MKQLITLAGLVLIASGMPVVAQKAPWPLSGSQGSQTAPSAPKEQKAKKAQAKPREDQGKKRAEETPKLSKEQIIKVQTVLKRYDYYEGPIDGELNPDMRQAIKDFQEDEGLEKTGELDEETLKRILALQDSESEEPPSEEPPSW